MDNRRRAQGAPVPGRAPMRSLHICVLHPNSRCPVKTALAPLRSARRLVVIHAALALLMPLAAQAQADALRTESLPTSGMLGFEMIRLPHGERMGLVGGSLLFDIGADWGIGPAVYGAATGQRGGFFVGGVELQRRWELGSGFSLATGLYAGGGGGANAPVGGGLMLRPAVTLLKDLGSSLQAGLSVSSVRFPSGQISSNQVGLTLAWRSEFVHYSAAGSDAGPAAGLTSSKAAGLGFDRMAATVTAYDLADATRPRITLAGARAERRSDLAGFTWGLEAAAAAQGGAAGYMEILGTAAYSVALLPSVLPSWRVGARLSAGLGGGGGVPTGGGLMGKATGTTELSLAPGWTLGAEFGALSTRSATRASIAQVWLGVDLEPGLDGRSNGTGKVVRTEWVGALEHHSRALRIDGTSRPLDTIGLKLNRYIGDHFYLSGQAHSAFAGGAGAYSVGLVGAGIVTSAQAPLRVGAELLVGAAGGGGVQTAGGGVTQGLLWAGWSPSPKSEWRAGIGKMRPLHGGAGSPVFELAWSRNFGMAGRR